MSKTYGVSPWDYVNNPARYQFDMEVTSIGADAEDSERRRMEGKESVKRNTTRRRYGR